MKQTTNYFAVLSLDEDVEDEKKTPLPSNPATPPPSGSPLIDALPTEMRDEIFAFVLQAPCSVVNVGHMPVWKRGRR